jgi:hypothetical protein
MEKVNGKEKKNQFDDTTAVQTHMISSTKCVSQPDGS